MKPIRVKICGITQKDQAKAICEMGADALGFILYKNSPRYIQPEQIREIIRDLPPFVKTVGVFVNEPATSIAKKMAVAGLDIAQLSGDETIEDCHQLNDLNIKWLQAFRIRDNADLKQVENYPGRYLLLDAWSKDIYGGTGHTFDWKLIEELPDRSRIILAGGLNPENIGVAVRTAKPCAIDVSSGVEVAPGIKSLEKVRLLFHRISQATAEK